MTAVDQHRELDGVWSSQVVQGVHCGAHGPTGVEDIVDENDVAARHVDGYRSRRYFGRVHFHVQVVAVHGDVQLAQGRLAALDLGDGAGDAAGEGNAASVSAHEHDSVGAAVSLDDFMGDAGQGPPHVVGVQQPPFQIAPVIRQMKNLPARCGRPNMNLLGDRALPSSIPFRLAGPD